MIALPPRYHGPTATGDTKLNHVLTGKLSHLNISMAIAEKVGHKLTALTKTNPEGAAQLINRLLELGGQGKLKFLGKSEHGFPPATRSAMFNGALVEMWSHHKTVAKEFGLPPDPRKIAY